MPNAIALSSELSAADLHRLAQLSKDAAQTRRLLALAARERAVAAYGAAAASARIVGLMRA